VIPSCASHCLDSLYRHHTVVLVKPGYHLSHCPNFWSPLFLTQLANRLREEGATVETGEFRRRHLCGGQGRRRGRRAHEPRQLKFLH
jgi:hypothetical protein